MGELLDEAAAAQERVAPDVRAAIHRRGGDTGRLQQVARLVLVAGAGPGAEGRLHRLCVCAPSGQRRKRRVGQVCNAGRGGQSAPGLVVGTGDHHPLVVSGAGEGVVGRHVRPAVAVGAEHLAGPPGLKDVFADPVHGRFHLGDLDILAGARAVALGQRRQHGGGAMQPADRIEIGRPGQHRLAVAVADQAGHASRRLHGLAHADMTGPGPVVPEGRHLHHHQLRVALAQRLVSEAELGEGMRREVRQHHIAPGREPPRKVLPAGRLQVE